MSSASAHVQVSEGVAVYLPLCERGQNMCVHVRLVDDRLSPDRTLGRRAASAGTRPRGGSVALLRLQVAFVHLVKLVEDGGHHR